MLDLQDLAGEDKATTTAPALTPMVKDGAALTATYGDHVLAVCERSGEPVLAVQVTRKAKEGETGDADGKVTVWKATPSCRHFARAVAAGLLS